MSSSSRPIRRRYIEEEEDEDFNSQVKENESLAMSSTLESTSGINFLYYKS